MAKIIPVTSQTSLGKGTWLIHQDGENTIQIWGSNVSGKEEVYLNGKLVSEKRSISRNSEHTFRADNGTQYDLVIQTTDLVQAAITYTLKRNGEEIKIFRTHYQPAKNYTVVRFIVVILISIAFALLKAKYQWPQYTFYIFIIAIPFLYFITREKGHIVIEE